MMRLYIYTTPAGAIASDRECFSRRPECVAWGYCDIFHVLWTSHESESALVIDNRINGVSYRTYNLQRPIYEGRNCQKV